jgi:REP element-mobilizing transposase RayT
MGRVRKRHVQQELSYWGGKRQNAGRRARGERPSQPHKRRPEHNAAHPVHCTLRLERDIGTLRRRSLYQACRRALKTVLGRVDYRVVDISLQYGHLHMIVEAEDKLALSKGMQAFQIAAARYINGAISRERGKKRKGRVFVDRYHPHVLRTPRAVRHARAYVLNNWRRHGEDRQAPKTWVLDPYSSAVRFAGWKETGGKPFAVPPAYEPLDVARAQTWLMNVGWQRRGLISTHERPGPRRP